MRAHAHASHSRQKYVTFYGPGAGLQVFFMLDCLHILSIIYYFMNYLIFIICYLLFVRYIIYYLLQINNNVMLFFLFLLFIIYMVYYLVKKQFKIIEVR